MKTLHIGNVANNAYLAALNDRRNGIEAYVLSHDYSHIMGSPEWEHCKISRTENRHFDTNFKDCLCSFKRPNWFFSGSLDECISKIHNIFKESQPKLNLCQNAKKVMSRAFYLSWKLLRPIIRRIVPLQMRALVVGKLLYQARRRMSPDISSIFNYFDIIIFYGAMTHLICDEYKQTKFVAMEHGTLRDFIFAPYPMNFATKVGYSKVGTILITNQDCFRKAQENYKDAEIVRYAHPVNDEDLAENRTLRNLMLSEKRNDINILIPSRHTKQLDIDSGKGNEKIYSVIQHLATNNSNIRFHLAAWGDNLENARKLLYELEKQGRVVWLDVLSRPLLRETIAKCDLVLDQFKNRAYGAITADCLAIGTPVVTAHSCENDHVLFESCAPVYSAYSSEEIIQQINKIVQMSSDESLNHLRKSQLWYDLHISEQVSSKIRINLYNRIVTS